MTNGVPPGQPYSGIPGILAWEIDPRAGELSVVISRDRPPPPPPPPSLAVEEEWSKCCRANPKLYDGSVLSVLSLDLERNEVLARRDSYKRLTVQPRVPTGVRLLSVTAILEARDAMGRPYVLLGRRSEQTRIYGGMWEIGPSGGVGMPPANVDRLVLSQLCASLQDEVSEEVGMTINAVGTPLAYVRDLTAHSDDIFIRFSLGALETVADLARPANWEYQETVWMPTDSASQFDTGETIAATRAAFRILGWLDMH